MSHEVGDNKLERDARLRALHIGKHQRNDSPLSLWS